MRPWIHEVILFAGSIAAIDVIGQSRNVSTPPWKV
jgi:hypothetical protein